VNSIEEINTLSDKVDALMKLVASKNAYIDPNDVPLSTLIEQNSDAIDVQYLPRNVWQSVKHVGNCSITPTNSHSIDLI
jgi:hypothetical protein